jgi:N-dimethylarginine dimethylaminohydrolase
MSQPRILMCPPDYYGIEYEINPWMSRARGAETELARQQWRGLHDALVALGVCVERMEARQGLPDLVFTANAGLVYRDRFINSQFRHEVRARETPFFDAWAAAHGFITEHLPAGMYFEGAGDALFCGPVLFAGYRIRSDALAHQEVGRRVGKEVLPLELVNPYFYHLDTCFCPLAADAAIYFPDAFDRYGRRVLDERIPRLIPVMEADAKRFGCNAVVVGKTVVINAGCEQLANDLHAAGFAAVAVELGEFLKAGGSAKCLTLRLDGEDAAVW